MATVTLNANVRKDLGSANARRDRNSGLVPAVVYGHGSDSLSITVDALEFNRILASETGDNTLITLDINGEKATALARQIHKHPTKPQIVHVDFIRVNVNEEVEAEVPLHLEGESEGVKDGGQLEQILFTIAVMAKPADIPVSLTLDVSNVQVGGQLQISDLELPSGVVSVLEPETVVVVVSAPRGKSEEEEAAELAEGTEEAQASTEAKADSGDKDKE